MVNLAALPDAPGIRLHPAELLALRQALPHRSRLRPTAARPGSVPGRQPGSGMDLREIRAYVAGDDLRRLDPSATARTGKPHVRSLHEDRDDTTLLIADFRAPMLWGTGAALRSVRAARHLAQVGWQAVAQGGSVAVLAATGAGLAELGPGAGQAQMVAVARFLSLQHDRALATPAAPPLTEALSRAHRVTAPEGRVVIATAPQGWLGAEAALSRLSRGRSVRVALILDEIEISPPSHPLPVSDGQGSALARLQAPDLAAEKAHLRAFGATAEDLAP